MRAKMLKSVRLATVGVWVQAVLNAAAGALLLAVVSDAVEHGQDEGVGLIRFVAVLSLLIAAALLLCGVLMGKRSNAIRVRLQFSGGRQLVRPVSAGLFITSTGPVATMVRQGRSTSS
ncbi:hypothetical protein ACFZCL_39565 [Streptomyces sp. NPDC008159]|uniref:hypothetical protein n=1 Tax=Streptomyces sp. NPDC008159 TaxID=3364817 RepID=UPI0036E467F9